MPVNLRKYPDPPSLPLSIVILSSDFSDSRTFQNSKLSWPVSHWESMSHRSRKKKAVQSTKRDRTTTRDLQNMLKHFNSDTYWGKRNFGPLNQSLNCLRIDVCQRQRTLILGATIKTADEFLRCSELVFRLTFDNRNMDDGRNPMDPRGFARINACAFLTSSK